MLIGLYADVQVGKDKSRNADLNISSSTDLGLTSALRIFSPKIHGEDVEDLKEVEEIKRKKRNRGMRRSF